MSEKNESENKKQGLYYSDMIQSMISAFAKRGVTVKQMEKDERTQDNTIEVKFLKKPRKT